MSQELVESELQTKDFQESKDMRLPSISSRVNLSFISDDKTFTNVFERRSSFEIIVKRGLSSVELIESDLFFARDGK